MNDDDLKAHEAFVAYAQAKTQADISMDFRDAARAARAWVAFLNVFLSDAQRLPTSNVVDFPSRRGAAQ